MAMVLEGVRVPTLTPGQEDRMVSRILSSITSRQGFIYKCESVAMVDEHLNGLRQRLDRHPHSAVPLWLLVDLLLDRRSYLMVMEGGDKG